MEAEHGGGRRGARRDQGSRLLAAAGSAYLTFALRTIRWTYDGTPDTLRLITSEPVIFAFWHERLLLMPALWRIARRTGRSAASYPKVNILVSRHRDGMMIARVIARFGGGAIFGSSGREKGGRLTDRGGAAAVRRAVSLLGVGEHVAVTPDGPRGPARRAKPGLGHLCWLSRRPMVACAARSWPHLRLPTWNRMMLPLPFGRGVIALGAPLHLERGAGEAVDAALEDLHKRVDGVA